MNIMKKHLSKIISLCFAIGIMMSCALVSVNAADDELTVNSEAKVKVGDKIKYTLYLSDTTEDIIGFQMSLFYDHNYLELNKDSIDYNKFEGVVHNLNIEDRIPMNWTDFTSPVSFSNKAAFLSLEFKVLKGGKTDISQFVTEMYGNDMTYLKSYKWTYDITVNDKKVAEDKIPVINSDDETLKKRQGSFINYLDGMGEANSPQKDEHKAVIGSEPPTVVGTQYQSQVVEVTKYVDADGGETSFNIIPIVVIIAVIVVAGAIVAILILKKRMGY